MGNKSSTYGKQNTIDKPTTKKETEMEYNCNNCGAGPAPGQPGAWCQYGAVCASTGDHTKPTHWQPVSPWKPTSDEPDLVNHPSHYISETGLEVIDVVEAFTFDLKGIEATDTGNIIKYICRWKHKNGLQDLKKAKWYLDHLINHVTKLEKENNI